MVFVYNITIVIICGVHILILLPLSDIIWNKIIEHAELPSLNLQKGNSKKKSPVIIILKKINQCISVHLAQF